MKLKAPLRLYTCICSKGPLYLKIRNVKRAFDSCKRNTDLMEFRRKKSVLATLIFLLILIFVLLGYLCGDFSCASKHDKSNPVKPPIRIEKLGRHLFDQEVIERDFDLNIEDEDVIVFLHIQKTGGSTFGRHLVRDLDLDSPCICKKHRKRCYCLTKKKTIWLFSRYSTGWVCGLHADWTELNSCVENAMNEQEGRIRPRRYYYITLLRDPVARYISEWKHVSRGATWKTAKLLCNGREATLEEVPFCFKRRTWKGVSLDKFLECTFNLANNRQARMLSNLSLVNCYNTSGQNESVRNSIILESAKANIVDMSFFGLTEYQSATQKLFEHTFNMDFTEKFEQYEVTHSSKASVSEHQQAKIAEVNHLDIEIYKFAKELFIQRVKQMYKEKNETYTDDLFDLKGAPDPFDSFKDDYEDEDDDDS